MSTKKRFARNLAAALLSAGSSLDDLVAQGSLAIGRRPRWLRPLCRRVLSLFDNQAARPSWEALATFLECDDGFSHAWIRECYGHGWGPHQVFWATARMAPAVGAPQTWQLPRLTTSTALARWLGVTVHQLAWFADCHGHEARVPPGPLRHYTYRWLPKAAGKWRLVEVPKGRLKALQRRILHEVLDRIPPHPAAHAYCSGRSIATFVAPHCGRSIVLRFDLRDFFPSIWSSRVCAVFRTAGYPMAVARLLAGLCTNSVPEDVWPSIRDGDSVPTWKERHRFRFPHLPQGAPTSPALANLCAYRLDCRLQGLAEKMGAAYTRYADDLAFSGDENLERSARRFQVQVCLIALEEGFEVHTRKSRFMRQGVRQQLVGIVVNAHPNISRSEYDRLKAILYNCVRDGPACQNRDGHGDFRAHLLGRIAHVARLNAGHGGKLRELFARIVWE